MPVALSSTSTSPLFGPSSCTVSILKGLPASKATAARTSMQDSQAVGSGLDDTVPDRAQGGRFDSTSLPRLADGRIMPVRISRSTAMAAFNAVRFRVKPGRDQEFLDVHRKIKGDWPGLKHINIIKTADRCYCI